MTQGHRKIPLSPAGAFVLAFLLLLCSCAVNPVTGEQEFMLVSETQELAIGDRVYPNALWSSMEGGGEFRDPELKAYLEDIVVDLHRASHRPELPVTFAIQNSSVPNAWALPGHVVITRGLLAGLESEAEFAFVMGHEIGHVAARHTARQMSYRMLQTAGLVAAGVALQDSDYGAGALAVGAMGSQLLMLKFSRSDELEADRLGVEYMAKIGYKPENAVKAHQNLEEAVDGYLQAHGKGSRERSFFEDLLSTHPRTEVRIEEIKEMQQGVRPAGLRGDGTKEHLFKVMNRSLVSKHAIYTDYYDKALTAYREDDLDKASSLVSTAIEKDSTHAPFHVLKGYIMIKREEPAKARSAFSKALEVYPGYEPAYRATGTLDYIEERYDDAAERLSQALEIFPGDLVSRFYLGMSLYKTGEYAGAAEHLGEFAGAQPKNPVVHYYLGASLEKTGEVKAAYNEYMNQVKVEPRNTEGRLARERLEALKPVVGAP